MSFDPPQLNSTLWTVTNSLIDLIFLIDIIICFRTTFIDNRGNEQTDSTKMALHYIKSSFIIDIAATVPFDNILQSSKSYSSWRDQIKTNGEINFVELLGIFKLGRVLRLNDIIYYMKGNEDEKAIYRTLKMILFLCIYIHAYACAWWLMIKI